MTVYPNKALITAIQNSNRPISILVGSPISSPDVAGGYGVPGVTAMLELIEQAIKDADCYEDYNNLPINASEQYQNAFEFVRGWIGQTTVNNIINKAVKKSYIEDEQRWYIPKGVGYLTETLKQKKLNVKTVLTTNFDPLIEMSLDNSATKYLRTIIHSDGQLSQTVSSEDDTLQIVHIHGFWEKADTLHTKDQLLSERPYLQASLKKLISNTTLLVIAYGGWDDVFIKALKDIMFESDSEIDILWAFFEKDEKLIEKKYDNLIKIVQPAIQRGRFRAYGQIDCSKFFRELNENINKSNSFKVNITSDISLKDNDLIKSLNAELSKFQKKTSHDGTKNTFKKYYLAPSPSHSSIRAVEQLQLNDILSRDNAVSIIHTWGMGRNGFLSSILYDVNSVIYGADLYKVDLENVTNIDSFNNEFINQIGANLTIFSLSHERNNKKCVLLIDNITNLKSQDWANEIYSTISILKDFTSNIYIILSGKRELLDFFGVDYIELKELDEPDANTYITNHPSSRASYTTQPSFDTIFRMSSGLPNRLDSIISQLKIISIDELVAVESERGISQGMNDEPIPSQLSSVINNYINNINKNDKSCFELLKVLAILSHGETYTNLKVFYDKNMFPLDVFNELNDQGLITSEEKTSLLSLGTTSTITHIINPLVGTYVRQLITPEETINILKRAIEITFGNDWLIGKIKINNTLKEQFKNTQQAGPGNAHILLCSYLKICIERNSTREIKALFNISVSYLEHLSEHGRYKDIITSATELLNIFKETPELLQKNKLHLLLAEAHRICGNRIDALREFEYAFENSEGISRKEMAEAKLEVALLYQSDKNSELALQYAKETMKLCSKGSVSYDQAEVITIQTPFDETKIEKLIAIERRLRNKKQNLAANNILLTLALEEKSIEKKLRYYDRVISSESDSYTKIRAVVAKGYLLVRNNKVDFISEKDLTFLHNSYGYLYMQRFDGLLGRLHEILWTVFSQKNNFNLLAQLFKYSSFIWRLKNEVETEGDYAKKLQEIHISGNITKETSYLLDYARIRHAIINGEK